MELDHAPCTAVTKAVRPEPTLFASIAELERRRAARLALLDADPAVQLYRAEKARATARREPKLADAKVVFDAAVEVRRIANTKRGAA